MKQPSKPGFEGREADWLEVDQARSRIMTSASPLPVERVTVREAEGRALAEEVVATATLPPWDNSAMDGYAVRATDLRGASQGGPVTLDVVGVVRAGGGSSVKLGPGEAVRIMTGAPLPPGADTVVRVEDTDREVTYADDTNPEDTTRDDTTRDDTNAEDHSAAEGIGRVRLFVEQDAGRHVRDSGQDMREGELLLGPGHTLTSGAIGVLVAAGRTDVDVRRRPSVAVLPTGDELRTPDQYGDVQRGVGIPESNGAMLSAMVREVGGEPTHLGIASDAEDDLGRLIESGAEADVLVTIGGASMGEADLVKRVLDRVGFEQDFWRVKMRPGSPISFGWLRYGDRRQAVFGLPGNPSSAFVTFEIFVRPYLLRLAGHDGVERRSVACKVAESFNAPADLTYFQRVTVSFEGGEMLASLTGPQGSGLVTGLARADGLAIIPPHVKVLSPGDSVRVLLLDTGPAFAPLAVG